MSWKRGIRAFGERIRSIPSQLLMSGRLCKQGSRWSRSLTEVRLIPALVAGSHVHGIGGRIRCRIDGSWYGLLFLLLLGNDLTCVELDQHGSVGLQFLYWNGKSEVIEHEELKLEMVQFHQRKAANLYAKQYDESGCPI